MIVVNKMIPEQTVLEVLNELTRGNREFPVGEFRMELSEKTGIKIASDSARYWLEQYILKGFLDRREINSRLFLYRRRKGANLSSSVVVKKV
jgi:hypothetical protein